MDQLPLNIAPRLSYAAENFLAHDGVRESVELFDSLLDQSGFRILFVYGDRRSGKTHLSLKCADLAARKGAYPRVLEGRELASRLAQEISFSQSDVYLIDDVHDYLARIAAGESGPFVSFVESLRRASAMLVLFSAKELDDLPCDEHVRSRLIPARGLTLKPPSPEFLPRIVDLMARQRGIKLTPHKIDFLIRRLERSIAEIEEYLERVNYLSTLFGKAIKMPLLSDAL